jgi:hypothetical protein
MKDTRFIYTKTAPLSSFTTEKKGKEKEKRKKKKTDASIRRSELTFYAEAVARGTADCTQEV